MKNNLQLIISDDNKVIDFNLQNILKKINYEEFNKLKYDLNSYKFSDLLDEASTISLFSSVKVIIGYNFNLDKIEEDDIEYLSKYINNYNKDIYIILIANKIDARKKNYKIFKDNFNIINNEEFNGDNVNKYINDLLDEKKYKIDDIEYFINKVGYDINNINSELDKLFIYKKDSQIITKDDIDLLIIPNIDNIMYEFTNAIMDNNYDKVTIMYNQFKKDNVSFDYLVSSLAGSIRTNLIIKLLFNDGKSNLEIGKIIGKKEFFVKKSLERLYMYTINDLTNYLGKLALIDKNYKSGKSNIDEFELFILNK